MRAELLAAKFKSVKAGDGDVFARGRYTHEISGMAQMDADRLHENLAFANRMHDLNVPRLKGLRGLAEAAPHAFNSRRIPGRREVVDKVRSQAFINSFEILLQECSLAEFRNQILVVAGGMWGHLGSFHLVALLSVSGGYHG